MNEYDLEPTEAELAEAEALARALEGNVPPVPPMDYELMQAAALLRYTDQSQLWSQEREKQLWNRIEPAVFEARNRRPRNQSGPASRPYPLSIHGEGAGGGRCAGGPLCWPGRPLVGF